MYIGLLTLRRVNDRGGGSVTVAHKKIKLKVYQCIGARTPKGNAGLLPEIF